MNALVAKGVSHAFGGRAALQDVSFAVPEGSFTLLLGANGAGKTTLVSLVTGLYHARHGEILIFGASLRGNISQALMQMGIVFQQPTLDLDLSVRENLRYHAALHGLSRRVALERAAEELARIGISDRAGEKVRALSGGLRRRVELARALLHRPRLLILDEPTVGLDLATRRAILAHIRALRDEQGLSVLWTTHLMDEVEPRDDVVILRDGRLLRQGRASDIMDACGATSMNEAFLASTGAAP